MKYCTQFLRICNEARQHKSASTERNEKREEKNQSKELSEVSQIICALFILLLLTKWASETNVSARCFADAVNLVSHKNAFAFEQEKIKKGLRMHLV